MPKLRLQIDADSITLDDMDAISGADTAEGEWKTAKAILWRFLVDDAGEPLPEEQARLEVGRLSLSQASEAMKKLRAAFEELKRDAVPNPTGSG